MIRLCSFTSTDNIKTNMTDSISGPTGASASINIQFTRRWSITGNYEMWKNVSFFYYEPPQTIHQHIIAHIQTSCNYVARQSNIKENSTFLVHPFPFWEASAIRTRLAPVRQDQNYAHGTTWKSSTLTCTESCSPYVRELMKRSLF